MSDCACCGLKLDVGQRAWARKLELLAGSTPHHVNLTSGPVATLLGKEEPAEVRAYACGCTVEMPSFVAAFMTAHDIRGRCPSCAMSSSRVIR